LAAIQFGFGGFRRFGNVAAIDEGGCGVVRALEAWAVTITVTAMAAMARAGAVSRCEFMRLRHGQGR